MVTYRPGSRNGKADALSGQQESKYLVTHPEPIITPFAILAQIQWNLVEEIHQYHAKDPLPATCPSSKLYVPITTFTQKAKNLKNALKVYDHLLSEHGANLQGHILHLVEVASSIDKVHKGVKIANITGGAAGAVGVAAAVGGVLLAPLTAGASLAVAAVGIGVAAAGGVTGASAAITNKVHTNMDRKKVETILQEHCTHIGDIEKCVKVIGTNIEGLKKYNLSTLKGLDWKAVKMARIANKLGDSVGAIGAVSKSSGMIQGFTLGIDMYFSKEDSKQLKKGSEAKFAKQIRKISKHMQTCLDELMAFKTVINSEDIGDEEVMGKFGVKERNLEVQMVVDFAKRMDMAVVSTYFQKRE
ncbi:hypothetical protein QTP70_000727 [Hemibagrus guttatus]|uniref:Apolipoprotein L3 n=1 Tax=Hemibagrus guttatus TaxID=175788 RepID=A0AAE0RIA3_9TELE|nr:hypothetical protein QTP70_000727 [Hemibagrus guttatus]